jgi:hypothetical protein
MSQAYLVSDLFGSEKSASVVDTFARVVARPRCGRKPVGGAV